MEANISSPLNGSDVELYDSATSRALWILSMVVLSITCVLGVLGNGLVIWVAGFRMVHTMTTICYLNLALTDFSFTATLPFVIVSMAMREKWPFGWFLCKLVHIMRRINLYGSMFLIALIALDCCIFVLHPVWAQNHRTVSLAQKVVVGSWILALILSLPSFLFIGIMRDPKEDEYCVYSFLSWGDTIEERLNVAITTVTATGIIDFIVGFSIPMSILTIGYGLVAAKIHRRGLANSGHPLHVLTAIVASFFICWLPCQLVGLLVSVWYKDILLGRDYRTLIMLIDPASALASFNSCLNPILYVFMARAFRKRLIHSLLSSVEKALGEDLAPTLPTNVEGAVSEDSTHTSDIGTNSTPPSADTVL